MIEQDNNQHNHKAVNEWMVKIGATYSDRAGGTWVLGGFEYSQEEAEVWFNAVLATK